MNKGAHPVAGSAVAVRNPFELTGRMDEGTE